MAEGGAASIELSLLEGGLQWQLDEAGATDAIGAELERVAAAAQETLAQAGITGEQVDAVYFTDGSTGFKPLAGRIAAVFPIARVIRGNRFSSVAQGLGLHAQQVFA